MAFHKANEVKNVRLLLTVSKKAYNSASFSLTFSIQILVMMALGHVYAKSMIYKGR